MSEKIEPKALPLLPPSPEARYYGIHRDLLAFCKIMPPNSSFAVKKGLAGDTGREVSYDLLRRTCAHYSVGNKVFCVIDHGHVFEIHRLEDGDNAKDFYLFHKAKLVPGIDTEDKAMNDLRNLLKGAIEGRIEEIIKYDKSYNQAMKADNIFSYSFIQRRLGCVSSFRKHSEGATVKIKECLKALVISGEIVLLSRENTTKTFGSVAILYRVVRLKGIENA